MIPWRSARINNATSAGIKSSPQSHCGAPKVIGSIASSRQFLPDRLRQQDLSDQQTATAHQAEREEIAILLVFFHTHGRFFQLVDVVIDLFQGFGICCSEKLSIGNSRSLFHTLFVTFYALLSIAH